MQECYHIYTEKWIVVFSIQDKLIFKHLNSPACLTTAMFMSEHCNIYTFIYAFLSTCIVLGWYHITPGLKTQVVTVT